ncbi:Uncharacterised protein [Shewanella putrefaciens]|nr:Uncharacterised protein [Shewanella putrefaciens]
MSDLESNNVLTSNKATRAGIDDKESHNNETPNSIVVKESLQ